MLNSVSIKLEGLLGERRDKAASDLVADHYQTTHNRTKASKHLIDRKHPKVRNVVSAAQAVRATVYKLTFPWGDSAMRLLPAKAFPEFDKKIRESVAELQSCIEEYIREYPNLVDTSRVELNGMFDATQYPDQDKLASMFKVSCNYWPMPASGHFVADIASDAANEARETIVRETIARSNHAVNDMVSRVESAVKSYVDRLSAYRKEVDDYGTTTISNIFRDSLIDNLREISRLTRAMNFTDDAGLEAVANQVERLARVVPDTLRNDKHTRDTMVTEGQQLLAKLDSYRKLDEDVDNAMNNMADYMHV
jgi:RNA polymerase-binding transcription factor DksA